MPKFKLNKISEGKKLKLQKEVKEEKKYSNIREVMDYTKDFTIFFSGVESKAYFDGCYNMNVRDFLMSYQYLQGSDLKTRLKGLDVKLFIDSGAFTYQMDASFRDKTPEFWESQIKRYLSWAEKNRDYIFAIANLDIENIVGGELVKKWNEQYFEPFMLRTGIPICFIWHPENTILSWEQYCQRYPYVGLTTVLGSSGFNEMSDMLKIAEKYRTLVHGMGMTQTSILPKLPFYTVDSTSWKAGSRYGQIAIWNGIKVQLKGKEDFQTKVFPVIDSYRDIHPPLDKDKIANYDEPEVLRCNVYAYLKAEEYIRERLKPLTYWKKQEAKVRKSVDDVNFPVVEWFNNPEAQEAEWEKYADEFNISKENKNQALDLIADMTIFMNWDNPEYEDYKNTVYTSAVLKELHDIFINKMVENDEDRVNDLINFYRDNLLGNNTTLLYLGTNFDRTIKERDDYLEDDEYDYVDASESEIEQIKAKFLPTNSEAPEIDSLDDEIFEQEGIIPVRDDSGRFLKGQHKVLKPKLVYSKKFPKLACDTCYMAQKCPQYKQGYACAYNKIFDKFNTRNMSDIIQAMQGIVDFSMSRVQRAMMAEILAGGIPDANTSALMDQSMRYLNQLKQMYEYGSAEVLRQTKTVKADGTQEMTTQITNPTEGGILSKIFGI
ncbi:MAG: hypothetical protein J6F30_12700 [Cellulosilyticum sp.]|nr:hypothetical protein [Cellulosilyticum sp.]